MQKNKRYVIFLILFGFHLDTFVMFRHTPQRMYPITTAMVTIFDRACDVWHLLPNSEIRKPVLQQLCGKEYNGDGYEREVLCNFITRSYWDGLIAKYRKKAPNIGDDEYLFFVYSLIEGKDKIKEIRQSLKEVLPRRSDSQGMYQITPAMIGTLHKRFDDHRLFMDREIRSAMLQRLKSNIYHSDPYNRKALYKCLIEFFLGEIQVEYWSDVQGYYHYDEYGLLNFLWSQMQESYTPEKIKDCLESAFRLPVDVKPKQ